MIEAKSKQMKSKQDILANFIKEHAPNVDCERQHYFQDGLEYVSVTYWNPSGKVCKKTDEHDEIEYFIYNDKNFNPIAWYSTEHEEGFFPKQ
jgi:sporulation-control protein spo0M